MFPTKLYCHSSCNGTDRDLIFRSQLYRFAELFALPTPYPRRLDPHFDIPLPVRIVPPPLSSQIVVFKKKRRIANQ